MLTLGIETSQIPGTIALCDEGRCLVERTLQPDRRHARTLVPEVRQMLADFGYRPQDCKIVSVSEGPGSFTGLRIGVTFAKAFAYATGALLAAVPTLTAISYNAPSDIDRLLVISDAQRQQLFVSPFSRGAEAGWWSASEISIVDAKLWASERRATDVVTGPALAKFRDLLTGRCLVLSEETWMPRASVIAGLGEKAIGAGRDADIWSLQPFYMRKSAAEERADNSASRPGIDSAFFNVSG